MPDAWLKATAHVKNEPPTAISQPVRASVRFRRVATSSATPATAAKPSSHAAWPPSASLNRRQTPGEPPNGPPPVPPPGPNPGPPARPPAGAPPGPKSGPPRPTDAARPARLSGDPAEAVIAEDQRPDRVVA